MQAFVNSWFFFNWRELYTFSLFFLKLLRVLNFCRVNYPQCQQTRCWPGQACMSVIVDHLKLYHWSLLIFFSCVYLCVCMPVNVAQCIWRAACRNPVYRTGPGAGTFTHWAILWPRCSLFLVLGFVCFLTKTTGKPFLNYRVCECVPRGSWIGRRTACGSWFAPSTLLDPGVEL